jgi:hypothetical protein
MPNNEHGIAVDKDEFVIGNIMERRIVRHGLSKLRAINVDTNYQGYLIGWEFCVSCAPTKSIEYQNIMLFTKS